MAEENQPGERTEAAGVSLLPFKSVHITGPLVCISKGYPELARSLHAHPMRKLGKGFCP